MCGAGCNSDHRLLWTKFVVERKRYFNQLCEYVSTIQGELTDDQDELTTKR